MCVARGVGVGGGGHVRLTHKANLHINCNGAPHTKTMTQWSDTIGVYDNVMCSIGSKGKAKKKKKKKKKKGIEGGRKLLAAYVLSKCPMIEKSQDINSQ